LLACDMFRTAISVLPNHTRVLSIVAKTAYDLRSPRFGPNRLIVEE